MQIGTIIPPGDIKKLVQKTADHVAKYGIEFQKIIVQREQHKPQFAFLQKQNPYRAYYDKMVAEYSKKLLQEIKQQHVKSEPNQVQPPKQDINTVEHQPQEVKEERINEKQGVFLDKIFQQIKEPDPQKYVSELPQKITEGELAIIQHTAQYVAKNGKNFQIALSERQKNNPQFQFLKSTSSNNEYFNELVQAYTNVLQISNEEVSIWQRYIKNKEEILDNCKISFEFHSTRQQQLKGKKQKENKTKQSNVDWNDFELVETITFEDANKNKGELVEKIQQHQQSKVMEEKIISEPKKRQILQQCHACRQNILASEMNKHLKTCLGMKKTKVQNVIQGGNEVDIRKNLQSMSSKRADIFGTAENKISRQDEEQGKEKEKVIYDGQASNITRSTGGAAMINFQQRKMRQQQGKK